MNKAIPMLSLVVFLLVVGSWLSRPSQISTFTSSQDANEYIAGSVTESQTPSTSSSTDTSTSTAQGPSESSSESSTEGTSTATASSDHSSTESSGHGSEDTLASADTDPVEAPAPASLVANLVTLVMLVLLQAVLGFDNLLYVSLESGRAPVEKQQMVRRVGIGLAIFFRIALLFILMSVIDSFKNPIFSLNLGFFDGEFNIHSLIVLAGGAFIMYTAIKEISHMMNLEVHDNEDVKPRSVASIITMIILMNIVFSFDSILSAMALSDTFWVMAAAIIIGGILMIVLSDSVSNFLKKNRMYEVLGLFVLFVVGIMLLTEGGHLAHMHILGTAINPMTKVTFYFVIVVLVLVDIVQGRYQRRIMASGAKH